MTVCVIVIEVADILTPDFLLVQQRIINSHPDFNRALSGLSSLSLRTIKNETQDVLAMGGQYFKIIHGVVCVGFGHWLASNPYDKHPWIGLLVIERSLTGKGIGKTAVQRVNDHLSSLNAKPVRLFVQVNNPQAFSFWMHNGFHSIEMTTDEHGRDAHILQKTESVKCARGQITMTCSPSCCVWGAIELIAQAVEAELQALPDIHVQRSLPDGRPAVARNGYLPERTISTGIGNVDLKVPKVRDRSCSGIHFTSALLPPYL